MSNPVGKKYNKVTNHDTKIITLDIEHLNKVPKLNLLDGRRNFYEITFENVNAAHRTWIDAFLKKGFSVIFKHEDKTKILKYNA